MAKPTIILKDIRSNQSSESSIDFDIHNVDVSVVNSLRRIMWAEIPTLAIELVEIEINSSPLHDEFIAHRLGLLPIDSTYIENMVFPRDCDCDNYCNRCAVVYYLDVKCLDDRLLVTSSKFTGDADSHQFQILPDISIVKLARNQHIKLKAIARKGVGRDHAKWSPSVAIGIKPHTEIKINKDKMDTLSMDEMAAFVASCPTKVYKFEDMIVDVEDSSRCTFCMECVSPKYPDLVSLKQKPKSFTVHLETTGALAPETIVKTSFEVLKTKLYNLRR